MNDAEILGLYPVSYAQARARFLAAAHAVHATVDSQLLSGYADAMGDPLTLDAAYLGPKDASRVLVMLAGTHGSEGYAASPLLTAFLPQASRWLEHQGDIGVLLVHAVNPYGFAHVLRTNEHNVDLNRNFIDFSKPVPGNPEYRTLHALLCPADRSDSGARAARAALDAWMAEHGQASFFDALFRGQYEVPEGLIYGGTERQWSNRALQALAERFLGQARRIAFVDWHTGLGEYGKPFFLCFNEFGGPEWERCCAWWGRDAVETRGGFNGAARPRYSGLVFQGMREFCEQAEFAGAVIEFGTTPPDATIAGLQLDNRLRFDAELGDAQRAALLEQAMESFCPQDPQWRLDVMQEGLAIARRAFDGLCAWS
ncbi:MAG: DUF2817 domain-containing protein [Castellaniella sp.]|uniref:DUF2817 domain-containing protein n=1 Tax=Castellaniella sp. TaxID=1955812 RepID=UPI003C781DA1